MKWEYTEIEVTIGGPLSGTLCDVFLYAPNGKHTRDSGKFGELLAKLGQAGWELQRAGEVVLRVPSVQRRHLRGHRRQARRDVEEDARAQPSSLGVEPWEVVGGHAACEELECEGS